MKKIFWVGDSTVQTNNYLTFPQSGIGQMFSLFLKEDYVVKNHAKNGRSTKSFLDEGRLTPVKEQIGRGDFLFIQFGHNDEKKEDPERYTEAFTGFYENLKIFIRAAEEREALPLLITPLERRWFDESGHLLESGHMDYVKAMKKVGADCQVPLVDLYEMSRSVLSREGDMGSKRWFMNFAPGLYENYPDGMEDNTHLRQEGAVRFARLIAAGVIGIGGAYSEMIIEEIGASL